MSWLQAIPYPTSVPSSLKSAPLQFRWYGLMYLIGLTAAYFPHSAKGFGEGAPDLEGSDL